MPSSEEGMNVQRLSLLTAEAVATVLRYHIGDDTPLGETYKLLIEESVEILFPLRLKAQDQQVAHLEIACDVAVTCAESFNKEYPEHSINHRWFYHCVQCILSIKLKPELLLDGQVERLRPQSHVQDPASSDTNPGNLPSSAPYRPAPVGTIKDAKTPWEAEEIQQMVELKEQGLTHKALAAYLGRGQSAVENKYGRVMKIERWRQHAAVYSDRLKRQHEEVNDNDQGGPSSTKRSKQRHT